MIKKAQATLEFSLVLIIIVALIAGLVSIAAWSRSHLIKRQAEFDATRVAAGSIASPGEPRDYYLTPAMEDKDLYLLSK
jgi:hypothetical protein